MNLLLATDLDRTLFPNGRQPYDGSLSRLQKVLEETGIPLVYVTGRNLDQIREGVREYKPPMPRYAIAEVGTRIYRFDGSSFEEDASYVRQIREQTPAWDIAAFKKTLGEMPALRLQEAYNQNAFKLSYYIDDLERADALAEETEERVRAICPNVTIVYSVDETIRQGLLDVLPQKANKEEGLAFVRRKMNVTVDDTIYSGDSGNDLLPLTSGCRGILVRNATDSVRNAVRRIAVENGLVERVYVADGHLPDLNGYYASGILEGLIHFGVLRGIEA